MRSALLSVFALIFISSTADGSLGAERAVLSKSFYGQIGDVRLLKIAKSLVAAKQFSDAEKALKDLERRPDSRVRFEVAKLRSRRLDSVQNIKIAIDIFSEILEGASPMRGRAAFELARIYRTNPALGKQGAVLEMFLRSAKMGNPKAYSEIAYLFLMGIGVEKDISQAHHYYQLAAKNYSSAPIIAFARYLKRSEDGKTCAIDPKVIVRKYFSALTSEATRGYAAAAKELARLHLEGTLMPQNAAKARKWLQVAVLNGDIGAMRDLALLELSYDAQSKNLSRSILMLKEAAAAGNAAALTALGRLQRKFDIPPTDDRLGGYFERGVAAGNREAMIELAHGLNQGSRGAGFRTRYISLARLARSQGVNIPAPTLPPNQPGSILADASQVDVMTTGSISRNDQKPKRQQTCSL